MSKLVLAVVLCDIAAHQLKAGSIVEAEPATIKSLQASGEVDPHKDAVAYAKSQGAPVVRSCIELAAEQREAARQALLVEIGQLEQTLAAATADDVKEAITAQIAAKRVEVAAID